MELLFLAILVLTMMAALGSGYPVAFALPGSAIITIGLAALSGYLFADNVDAYFAQGGPLEWLSSGVTNFRGIYWEVERDTLIAIPLFVFMGIMLQRSKIAEDLLVAMAQLFGPLPGGLGISVVFVGALLAATTGIVGATVVAMGLISLPAMMRNNYANELSTGTIAASGTLGQIIPPSIVLIILADQLASAVDQASTARKELYKENTGDLVMPSQFDVSSTSAGEMFLGALIPGLILVGLYMLYIFTFALLRPHLAPAVPYDGRYDARFFGRVALTLIPPLALILIVLGSILAGVATVNQAGAIGAAGALIMAGYRLYEGRPGAFTPAIIGLVAIIVIFAVSQINPVNIKNLDGPDDQMWLMISIGAVAALVLSLIWSGYRALVVDDTLRGVMIETAKTTSLVFIILLGAAMLTSAFRAFGGEELVKEFLTGLPGGFWAQFFTVMAVIFLLGFFLDFIEIAVVVVPIVAPILLADPSANVTAVWLGVMIGLNIQTSFLTPPFGFALFYLRGVAPAAVRTLQMYKGVVVFIALQLVALVIVAQFPALVNYLPNRSSLTGDTAPPPVNPRLQACVEEYKFRTYAAEGPAIRAAITQAEALDLSDLPNKMQRDFKEAMADAGKTFELVDAVNAAEAAIAAAAPDYEPLHRQVRRIQRDIRRDEEHIRELEARAGRARRQGGDTIAFEQELNALRAEVEELKAQIPASWEEKRAEFVKLRRAEQNARRAYQRNVDGAYEEIREVAQTLATVDQLKALTDEVAGLRAVIETKEFEPAQDDISQVRSLFSDIPGTRDVSRSLSRARRGLRGRSPSREKALEELEKAQQALAEEIAWRTKAGASAGTGIANLEAALRDNIGLRKQPKLPYDIALEVASCNAVHRDLTLNF